MDWKIKKSKMKNSFFFLLLFSILLSCQENKESDSRVDKLPFYEDPTFKAHWIADGDSLLDNFHQISPFQLLNQDGATVTEKTFEGKIYVADFFFTTCPGICPKMTANMSDLQKEFLNDEEVLLLSHSVMPDYDSVAVLKSYADNKGIVSGKWHLVTGTQKEIYRLGRMDYFVEEDLGLEKSEDEFLHTENFVLIDHSRHIRGIYNGLNKASVKQLIVDIKALKKES